MELNCQIRNDQCWKLNHKVKVEEWIVSVTKADAVIMMKNSTMDFFTKKVFASQKWKKNKDKDNAKKKRRTGGNAACSTVDGANGHCGLHTSN